ncbi:MAG: glycosyltransferase family 2 protein [Bryobacteraceae bacterium]|nr:glycosyltransferase family 2 protein [Bryobacteraceae bacterium]
MPATPGNRGGVLSLVVPLYKSEANLPDLLKAVAWMNTQTRMEAVFVVDGSPDRCAEILRRELPGQPFESRLVELSRNFGAFSAITAGMAEGTGDYFALLAADLQEPPELILKFVKRLESGDLDVVVGQRSARNDPFTSRVFSSVFWYFFRKFAVAQIPPGGVDTFGCTRQVRDSLLALPEVDSSLVSLLFWVGYRRETVAFERRQRTAGKSAWSMKKKIDYAINSFFNFTDLPVRLLIYGGAVAAAISFGVGLFLIGARLSGLIQVPGYTALALLISFYGGLTMFALGVVGQYIWLALQNARRRPNYIVRAAMRFAGSAVRTPARD